MVKTTVKYMTQNDCYKTNRKITVKGLMVHSTATPGVMAARWFDLWNKPGISKGVHGFLDDKEFFQYLPWDHRGWHCGAAANSTHIGIEFCEPKDLKDKEYFAAVWKNGVELYAKLCKDFKLTEKNIISHKEGYKLGVASNHGDPDHWWKLHNKTMDDFRADVKKALAPKPVVKPKTEPKPPAYPGYLLKNGVFDDKNVGLVQKKLGIKADDDFGATTEKYVRAWQKANGLKVDGKVGPATWKEMFK